MPLGLTPVEQGQRLDDEVVVFFLWQSGHRYRCNVSCPFYLYREGSAVGGVACLIEPSFVFEGSSAESAFEAN